VSKKRTSNIDKWIKEGKELAVGEIISLVLKFKTIPH